MPATLIYHICRAEEWSEAEAQGQYAGSSQDRADGFIHFSGPGQLRASAAKHRAGQSGLLLIEVATEELGEALRWEPSRGGALFPHLYGRLPLSAVTRTWPLPLEASGRHGFPEDLDLTA
ncbi:MAG: DUF952 domain-containing protein [Rhodospirillales bacterium]